MFNVQRLSVARKRRQLTCKTLAEKAGISAVHLTRLEKGESNPDDETVRKLAAALYYPFEFFYKDIMEEVETNAVSFRSLSKITAKERNAAISAGQLGIEVASWVDERFNLPESDLPDLSYETNPEIAAKSIRTHWGIGEKPIGNVVHLLEAKGVRVFSLSENTKSVDAFSFWMGSKPFVFLNTFKTPERSIMDAAHELGHLVMHKHGGTQPCTEHSRQTEREADLFASAFLMPRDDVKAHIKRPVNTADIINAKKRWRVSAMALAYRLNSMEILSDWQYKSACIELTKRGYRVAEPKGIEREKSAVWHKILTQLWKERTTKEGIASNLGIPLDELESLIWNLTSPNGNNKPEIGRYIRAVE